MTKIAILDSSSCLNTEGRYGKESRFELPIPMDFTSTISEENLTQRAEGYMHNI